MSEQGSISGIGLEVADQATALLAYWDKDLICRFANNAYQQWFGRSRVEMVDKIHIKDLLGPLYEKNLPYINGVLGGDEQIFEREIPMPDGKGVRHSLATYLPDLLDGTVRGFFVHVADVTYVKNLEKKVINSKREMLKQLIVVEEDEKMFLADRLSESLHQKLATCSLLISLADAQKPGFLAEIKIQMAEIFDEIREICSALSPATIPLVGLLETLESYIHNCNLHSGDSKNTFSFAHEGLGNIEKISITDKLAIFRIIQNFTQIVKERAINEHVQIRMRGDSPLVQLEFKTASDLEISEESNRFNTILTRVEYYAGQFSVVHEENSKIYSIFLNFDP